MIFLTYENVSILLVIGLCLIVGWFEFIEWWFWDSRKLPSYFWYHLYQNRLGGDWKNQLSDYQGFTDWGFSRWAYSYDKYNFYWHWLSFPISYGEFCDRCQECSWIASRSLRRDKGIGLTIEPSFYYGFDLKEFNRWKFMYHWYQDYYVRLVTDGS